MPLIPIEHAVIYQGKVKTDLHFSYGDVSYFPFTVVELKSGGHIGIGEGLITVGALSFIRVARRDLLRLRPEAA